jgi:nephrocystin-3
MPPYRPQIRTFLSSTFSDFLEERSLLVKQVFPALRRKAKERGVEVVEVDLRWGITEEQSKQGQTIGICLDEIERCRPYFIGLLGDRYGWVPEKDDYRPELLRRQDWLPEHQGNASVTELEILHGVLNNPEMAGRAFFYFRDPAYSDAKAAEDSGWRSKTPEERQKLEALKQRIRDSGFPVVEDLATPQAIAEQIEADLWSLIEEQYPEAVKTDALTLEAGRHASYRADRTGLYLGGEVYIKQLQDWISTGEQRILITGDSGAGKSALIANWVAAHESSHPDDVIFCHHLGSSNDASALRPLMARMIDSASRLLAEELSEPLKVPQDWWELVTQVTNTLSRLSSWAIRHQRRWIWVLDGLDKLDLDDQQALPWLPLVLPKGVYLVASALDCPIRTLLQERIYATLTIGPLAEPEREQLIQKYLSLYTKELVPALRQKITSHPQGSSPLFLRVLLEELRLCGKFETLAEQLQGYLTAESVADLYELVLQRLEQDGHGDAVQKVMTALWASRAGLSENELLAFTGLAPVQWAPISIGLQEALSEANGRLVFGHDFLRQAVRDRYLPTEEQRRQSHSDLADWFEAQTTWDARKAEELPWQLVQSDNSSCLRELLVEIDNLEKLATYLKPRDIYAYWRICMASPRDAFDAAIAKGIEIEIKNRSCNAQALSQFATLISQLLEEGQLYHGLLLRLRVIGLEASRENCNTRPLDLSKSCIGTDSDLPRLLNLNQERYSLDSPAIYTRHELKMLDCLANAYFQGGHYSVARNIYVDSAHGWQKLCGSESIEAHFALSGLAKSCSKSGVADWAETMYARSLRLIRKLKGKHNPATIKVILGMALNYTRMGKHRTAEKLKGTTKNTSLPWKHRLRLMS